MTEQEIIARIHASYPNAIVDAAGEACSFELYIVDKAFEGLGTLQRQKPLLALFKDEIASGAIHALTIKTKTPAEQAGDAGLVQISS